MASPPNPNRVNAPEEQTASSVANAYRINNNNNIDTKNAENEENDAHDGENKDLLNDHQQIHRMKTRMTINKLKKKKRIT